MAYSEEKNLAIEVIHPRKRRLFPNWVIQGTTRHYLLGALAQRSKRNQCDLRPPLAMGLITDESGSPC
jgi:hypothetical protein